MATPPDYSGPAARLHDRGRRGRLDRLHAAAHLPAQERRRRDRADPRTGAAAAADLAGRPHLPARPSQGARLLQRPTGGGERLRVHDRARHQARLARQAIPHRQHRRRRGVRARRGAGHLRHLDRRRERPDQHQARPALGGVRERAGAPRHGPGPERDADARPERQAPSGCRRLPDHRRRAGPQLDDGQERPLRAARDPRRPARQPGAGLRQDRAQPGSRRGPGAGRSRGRLRPRRPVGARNPIAGASAGLQALRHARRALDALFLPEHRLSRPSAASWRGAP